MLVDVKRYICQLMWCFFLFLPVSALLALNTYAQGRILDDFESPHSWTIRQTEGVRITTSKTEGKDGNCVRMAFNFRQGMGYGGINKRFPMQLPENYRFTFWLKAHAPVNNLEFKLIDASGDNVWWVNRRNVEFSQEWQKITIKKRHIQFAWGPTDDRMLKAFDKIEFIVASATGGKGVIYLDQLTFEPLAPPSPTKPALTARASSVIDPRQTPANLLDEDLSTQWRSRSGEVQEIELDLQQEYEYGGLIID